LDSIAVEWKDEHAACVVLASGGYPGDYKKDKPIRGLDKVPNGVEMYHAGTSLKDGVVLTAGGRVLNATASGPTLKAALDKVYAAIPAVSFDGMFFRRDIGWKALKS
jgi:phosphoribosylamine--glycine ligase